MARPIKLNGREAGVIRAIGFGLGISGAEVQERMQMDGEALVDLLNSLLDMGYIETPGMSERVTAEGYAAEMFEVNPSYAAILKTAIRR